jgi:hypothetical protein
MRASSLPLRRPVRPRRELSLRVLSASSWCGIHYGRVRRSRPLHLAEPCRERLDPYDASGRASPFLRPVRLTDFQLFTDPRARRRPHQQPRFPATRALDSRERGIKASLAPHLGWAAPVSNVADTGADSEARRVASWFLASTTPRGACRLTIASCRAARSESGRSPWRRS